jgi:hypothetical protein
MDPALGYNLMKQITNLKKNIKNQRGFQGVA